MRVLFNWRAYYYEKVVRAQKHIKQDSYVSNCRGTSLLKIKQQYEKMEPYMSGNTAGQKSIFSTVLKFKNKYRTIAKLVFLLSKSADSNYDMQD